MNWINYVVGLFNVKLVFVSIGREIGQGENLKAICFTENKMYDAAENHHHFSGQNE